MNQAKHAKKSIVKIFGKHIEEFRREMQYSKEIINSDLISQQEIPDSMIRHAENFNLTNRSGAQDPFKKVVTRFSIDDNFTIEDPDARTSNLSNSRPVMNQPI